MSVCVCLDVVRHIKNGSGHVFLCPRIAQRSIDSYARVSIVFLRPNRTTEFAGCGRQFFYLKR